jgi:hypothetical protein
MMDLVLALDAERQKRNLEHDEVDSMILNPFEQLNLGA